MKRPDLLPEHEARSDGAGASACRICNGPTALFANGVVLGRHAARFERCERCGFMQVPDAHWLDEAYSEAIADIDIGTIDRMIECAASTRAVLHACFDPKGRFLDFGAGYGAFVRRMRDLGYDFHWFDRNCENLFAKRFEGSLESGYSLVTAFEVAEHLVDPFEQISLLMQSSPALLFTTLLLNESPPSLDAWPYYALETGQHISFFTERSLQVLAQRLGVHFVTDGVSLHLFSRSKVSAVKFRFVTRPKIRRMIGLAINEPTLLYSDYEEGRRAALANRR